MRIYFFEKNSLSWGMAGLIILGLLAFAFLKIVSPQMAAVPAQAVYQGNSGQKAVAICINVDWGEEYLPDMLKVLKEHEAKVTFFVTGQWAGKNPELIKQMQQEGHSIQNHGYKHLHFNNLSGEQAREQIIKTGQIIKKLTRQESVYFAPPYGEFNNNLVAVAENLNYKLIMWSIDTIDWELPAADTIVKRVTNQLHNDAIILMHPTQPTLEALPELIAQIKSSGYQILTLDKIILIQNEKNDKHEKTNL
ncbi:MAG TPA: polysaccharide deacetylase family protein [Syntrophomonadaceae bacterium]|nr:polysaccharide deacetylase family protein [Syntrophomonadaceae bacterium]HPR93055.1 polysaccharide deacetylase family protein [Syntrophomonadaceae bacterium]